MSEATEAAFSNAVRVTLAGSKTPTAIKFSYWSVFALYPNPSGSSLTFDITKSAETSPLAQICRSGASIAL